MFDCVRSAIVSWIPGNFLAPGTIFVDVAIIAIDPIETQIWEPSIIAFQMMDTMEGDSARGDWAGPMSGAVRPAFEWTTEYERAALQAR